MNGYSKIGTVKTNLTAKSKSVDLSDLSFSPPQTPKYSNSTTHLKTQHELAHSKIHDPFSAQEEEGGAAGERFGVILSRNCSSASQRFGVCHERAHSSTTLQAVARRAFSMRKPSSVSDGYWRIHDHTAEEDDGGNGDVDVTQQQHHHQMRPPTKKKRGKILRACKRLFGF